MEMKSNNWILHAYQSDIMELLIEKDRKTCATGIKCMHKHFLFFKKKKSHIFVIWMTVKLRTNYF